MTLRIILAIPEKMLSSTLDQAWRFMAETGRLVPEARKGLTSQVDGAGPRRALLPPEYRLNRVPRLRSGAGQGCPDIIS
jgi:hypothetical protein